MKAHTTDVEILLEAIELKEIGKLEGADIAAPGADFALQVADNPAQIFYGKAGPQPFVPLPLPIKAQAQALTG